MRYSSTSHTINRGACAIALLLLSTAMVCTQSCRTHQYLTPVKSDYSNYVEFVNSAGFVGTSIYSYDEGWRTYSSAAYRIREKRGKSMIYDLATDELFFRNIYDTMTFYIDFSNPYSSFYMFLDSEYNRDRKAYECTVTTIPLLYKGKLVQFEDCEGCEIFKFESFYRNECYTWFVSDSIGFLKRYAPYHQDQNDYEISFQEGTPKSNYSLKLLKAIKADASFHTRCSPGALW